MNLSMNFSPSVKQVSGLKLLLSSKPRRLSSSMEETRAFLLVRYFLSLHPASWSRYISGRLSWPTFSLKSLFGTIPVLYLHLGLDEPWTFNSQLQPEPTQWLNRCLLCVLVICFHQIQVLVDNYAATHYLNSNSSELPPPLSSMCTTCHKMIGCNLNS